MQSPVASPLQAHLMLILVGDQTLFFFFCSIFLRDNYNLFNGLVFICIFSWDIMQVLSGFFFKLFVSLFFVHFLNLL